MLIIVLSVVAFTLCIERVVYLRRCSVDIEEVMKRVKKFLDDKKYEEGVAYCQEQKKPAYRVFETGIANRSKERQDVEELMLSVRLEERAKMERYLSFLASMGGMGPLLGLMGTVIGLSRAFKDLALSGSAGPSVVAAGIAEALFATVAGLAVAIPTILLYNYYMGKVRKISADIDVNSMRLIVWLYSK
jgi:biopolymer transport protein ExbB